MVSYSKAAVVVTQLIANTAVVQDCVSTSDRVDIYVRLHLHTNHALSLPFCKLPIIGLSVTIT